MLSKNNSAANPKRNEDEQAKLVIDARNKIYYAKSEEESFQIWDGLFKTFKLNKSNNNQQYKWQFLNQLVLR